jgi:hypothetical protein
MLDEVVDTSRLFMDKKFYISPKVKLRSRLKMDVLVSSAWIF